MKKISGRIQQVGSFGFAIVPDDDPSTRYAPTAPLPDALQADGVRVRFCGHVGDPGEGRRWGTPFEVTAIERLEGDHPSD